SSTIRLVVDTLCTHLPSAASSFVTDPPLTALYTLSLHDALPISRDRPRPCRCGSARRRPRCRRPRRGCRGSSAGRWGCRRRRWRSEEHTSELQSRFDLVCRLLLEKKNTRVWMMDRIDRAISYSCE